MSTTDDQSSDTQPKGLHGEPTFKERRQAAHAAPVKTFSTRSIIWLIVSSLLGLGGFLYFSGEEGGNFALIEDLQAVLSVLALIAGFAVIVGTFIGLARRNRGSSLVSRQLMAREENERMTTETPDSNETSPSREP